MMHVVLYQLDKSTQRRQLGSHVSHPHHCPQQLPPLSHLIWHDAFHLCFKASLRPQSHYGRNDGDGMVTFYWSHYTFRNANVSVALTCHKHRRDNGYHDDVHGNDSRRCLFGSAQAKK